jgi:5'-phosphate synthase pdxT subunit
VVVERISSGVGVLALQGDFDLHAASLVRLGCPVREVRTERELEGLTGLIIPGGESTTMLKLMERTGLDRAVAGFHERGGSLFGTCAGLILLARQVTGPEQRSLGLLDVDVERNAYGRQSESFETDLTWNGDATFRGVFIRAPRISRVGDTVTVLARVGGDPVLVHGERILAASFHPELTSDDRLHRHFLEQIPGKPDPHPTVFREAV